MLNSASQAGLDMPEVNMTIYNKSEISKWKEELARLDRERELLEGNIRLLDNTMTPLNLALQQIQIQINTHESDYYRNMRFLNVPTYSATPDPIVPEALTSLRNQYNTLDINRRAQQGKKEEYDAMLKAHKTRIDWLKKHIKQGEQFLDTLNRHPEHLVIKLSSEIVSKFKMYEKENPDKSSPQVRLCLFNIKEKLDVLDVAKLKSITRAGNDFEEQNNARLNYLLLCTFLWQRYHQINQEEPFATQLAELLESTHVLEQGDLPDEFSIGRSVDGYLSAVEQQNKSLFPNNSEELLYLQKTLFVEKIANIKDKLHQRNHLDSNIVRAIDCVEGETTPTNKSSGQLDYYFYNCLIDRLDDVLQNPLDHKAGLYLEKLAELTSGRPSFTKKLKGILLSIAGLVLTLGFLAATLVFIPGIPFVVPLSLALQCKIGIGIGFFLGALTGSGVAFWGAKVFNGGKRQGLSWLCKEIGRCIPPEPLETPLIKS